MALIGLDSLFYSKITESLSGDEIYGTPVKLAKAIEAEVSIELNEAILYADDGTDTVIKEFKSGTITLGVNDIGKQAARDLTGAALDANGVLVSAGEDEPTPVAIGFRAKTAKGMYRYFWIYRVLFGIPGTTLKTKGDSIEFQTPSIEGTISRRNKPDEQSKHPWKAEVTDGEEGVSSLTISNWFQTVYEPNFTQADATLSSLTLGSLTLSPTFNSAATEYTATTENATNTITAVAIDNNAGIAITVNGNSISSGQSATWESGINTVAITVTNGNTTKTYTITVTKGE
jgi:phi13 family phage major tail protein